MPYRTLFERETLEIVDDGGIGHISSTHYELLAKLEPKLPKGTLGWTGKGVRMGSHCGVLRVGTDTVEILPKVFRDGNATEQNRALLIHLLKLSRRLPWLENWQGSLGLQSHHLLDVFIKKFCDDLNAALVGGLTRSYRQYTQELSVVRGRLDVMDHIRRTPGNKHRVLCHFDEFDSDIPLNRVLRHCVEKLSSLVRSSDLKNVLDELRFRFEEVSPIAFHHSLLEQIRLDRTQSRFRLIWEQCCWLLRGLYPTPISGNTPHASLLFDMEVLFEEAVSRLLHRELTPQGFDCRFQGPQRSLLRGPNGESPRRRMRPDIVLFNHLNEKIILDCKWKILDEPEDVISQISQADLYQVHTYATEYEAKAVGLIYPWVPGLPENPIEMQFNTVKVPIWIHFVKMDVFNSRNAIALTSNWKGILDNLI